MIPNFKGPDFGASGRGNAGAHMSGICIFIISKMCSFKLSRFQLVPRSHEPGQFWGGGGIFASGRGNAGAHMSGMYIFCNVITSLVIWHCIWMVPHWYDPSQYLGGV